MTGHGSKLAVHADKFVSALLTTKSVPQAAAAVGVSERTGWRWLTHPKIRRQYERANAAILGFAIGEIRAASLEALQALRAVCRQHETQPAVAVSAAKAILELSVGTVTGHGSVLQLLKHEVESSLMSDYQDDDIAQKLEKEDADSDS